MFDKEYTQEKAAAFVSYVMGELPASKQAEMERVLYGIMTRTRRCRNILAELSPYDDATRVLKNMVRSLQSLLQETDNATLRTFLFTCPKRQPRALAEISARLHTLEWICRELKRQRRARMEQFFTRVQDNATKGDDDNVESAYLRQL